MLFGWLGSVRRERGRDVAEIRWDSGGVVRVEAGWGGKEMERRRVLAAGTGNKKRRESQSIPGA